MSGWIFGPVVLFWLYCAFQSAKQTWEWLPLAVDPVSAQVVVTKLESESHSNLRGGTYSTEYVSWRLVGEREVHRMEVDYGTYAGLQALSEGQRRMWIVYRRGQPDRAWCGDRLEPPWDYVFGTGAMIWLVILLAVFLPSRS